MPGSRIGFRVREARQPQQEPVLSQALGDVVTPEPVFALRSRTARSADEAAHCRIRGAIRGQSDDLEVGTNELAADDELQRQILGGRMRSHDSGHGTDRKSTRLNSSHSQISYAV